MKRVVEILSDRIVKGQEEASIAVKTREEVEEAIEELIEFVSTHSDIVYIRVLNKVFNENHRYWSVAFEVRFDIADKYVNNELYKEGGAIIYLSNAFYDDVDDIGAKLFSCSPSWNNDRTAFTFSGRLKV